MAEYEICGPNVTEVIRDVRTIVIQDHGWNDIDDSLVRDVIGKITDFGSYRGYWSSSRPYELAAQTCAAQTNRAVKMFQLVDEHLLGKILPINTRALILASIHHCRHT